MDEDDDLSPREFLDGIKETAEQHIAEVGRTITGFTNHQTIVAYTIGNCLKNLPELLIAAPSSSFMHAMNEVSESMIEDTEMIPEEHEVLLVHGLPCVALEIDPARVEHDPLFAPFHHYRDVRLAHPFIQIVWPGFKHAESPLLRYPTGCNEWPDQPLLTHPWWETWHGDGILTNFMYDWKNGKVMNLSAN